MRAMLCGLLLLAFCSVSLLDAKPNHKLPRHPSRRHLVSKKFNKNKKEPKAQWGAGVRH